MAAILTLKNITKQFGGLTAVNDLSMTVEEHSIHALIGPNGAGKTTATNMIEGVFPPTSGQIFYRDTEITNMNTHEIANLGIGRTFQNIKLYNTMTALENVMVGGHQLTKMSLLESVFNYKGLRAEEKMLRENIDALHKISEFLIEKETITGEQFMTILKSVNEPETEEEKEADEPEKKTDE